MFWHYHVLWINSNFMLRRFDWVSLKMALRNVGRHGLKSRSTLIIRGNSGLTRKRNYISVCERRFTDVALLNWVCTCAGGSVKYRGVWTISKINEAVKRELWRLAWQLITTNSPWLHSRESKQLVFSRLYHSWSAVGRRGNISEEIHADRILMSIIINSRLLAFVFCSVRPHERLIWIFGNFATEVTEIFANYSSLVFPGGFFFFACNSSRTAEDWRWLSRRSEKRRGWTVRVLNRDRGRRVFTKTSGTALGPTQAGAWRWPITSV